MHVALLFTQVGDLPVRQIPLRLSVVGSPLVLSKERVLLQGLQALLSMQHAPAGLGATAASQTDAATASSSTVDALPAAGHWAAGCVEEPSSVAAAAAAAARGGADRLDGGQLGSMAGVTAIQLAMGVVPVGVVHEQPFYVVNTGEAQCHTAVQECCTVCLAVLCCHNKVIP